MEKDSRIYVAGSTGMVGSAVVRQLQKQGYHNIVNSERVDLRERDEVDRIFDREPIDCVVDAAAKVGGIGANSSQPAEFIYDNLSIQTNLIDSAYKHGIKKFLFLGSTCIYPRICPQPMKEESLLSGHLEPTNETYAIAKIAGIKMCEAYRKQYRFNAIAAQPTNLYGPYDNFDLNSSHVVPALIRKLHEAKVNHKIAALWGTGKATREFLYVEDLAEALVVLLERYDEPGLVNIGTGEGVKILELAHIVAKVVGYEGPLFWDTGKPDGTPIKVSDVSKIHSLGWKHSTSLPEGIAKSYKWFLENPTWKKSQ